MKPTTKDTIATISACVMLAFGIILTSIGFVIEPVGEIHDSVLWVLGQSLLYAGGIFGITVYAKRQINKQFEDFKQQINEEKLQNYEQEKV